MRGVVADRVCLYALVAGAGRPVRAAGIGGERLRTVDVGGVRAVIGTVARAPKPSLAAMRRYDDIERAVMKAYGSMLPARFGTCAATVDELARAIRDRRLHIRRNLRLVQNRVQMTVRLMARPVTRSESSPSQLRAGSEHGDGTTQGTRYLQQRVAETRIPGADPLRAAVARWVRAERTERQSSGPLAGTLYHLVPRSAVPAYCRAVGRTAAEGGLTILVSGPWPPYAFSEEIAGP